MAGAPRGAGAAGVRSREARTATRLLLPRRLRATQRVGHQLPLRAPVGSLSRIATVFKKLRSRRGAVNCMPVLDGVLIGVHIKI